MPLPRRDFFDFLFNDGRGLRTSQLDGAIVRSISDAGVAELTLADGTEMTVTLARDVVLEDRDPTEADYGAKRLFYDGIELRKIVRVPTPGHDRVVNFADDVSHLSLLGLGIYADRNTVASLFPFATRETGLRYFRRDQARWELWQEGQYWDTGARLQSQSIVRALCG